MQPKKFVYIAFVPVLDLLFLAVFGIIFQSIFFSTTQTLEQVNTIMQQETGLLAGNDVQGLLALSGEVRNLMKTILWSIAYIGTALFAMWTVFEGLVWFIIARFAGSRIRLWKFAVRTVVINLAALAILSIFIISTASRLTANQDSLGDSPPEVPLMIKVFSLALLFLLFTAYALAGHDKTLGTIVKDILKALKNSIVPFAAFTMALLFLGSLTIKSLAASDIVTAVAEFLLLLAAMTLTRVWLARNVWRDRSY